MNYPSPRKYRKGTSKTPICNIRALKIPGFFVGAAVILVSGLYLIGGEASATIVNEHPEKYSFNPVCRWCGKIKRDESLYIALTNAGMSPRVVYDINLGLENVFDVRKVMPGDLVFVDLDSLGNMFRFELERSPWEHYSVVRHGDTLLGSKDTIPLTYVLRAVKGEVDNTLWESMAGLGVPAEAILKFTDILSYDVDFLTETRPGQKFAIMYEEYYFNGEQIDVGRVMAAHFWMSDTNYAGIYYMDPESTAGYYTLKGKNTKKALLRTPLVYRRISSFFSHRRFHPILKIYRPHLGVDYAAPIGTPVSASGDGTVIYAGWKGGYGKFIEIKHTGGKIHTMYGHLSRFASGIRKGVKVRQGQVIGYVGSTGLSTGPHLDYRVTVNGSFVNPLKYAFPDGPPVKSKYMADFGSKAKSYLTLLDMLTPPVKPAEKEQMAANE
ncbi:hypothetical protein DRQ36_01465 [bacterium]|nr:MAG: hypothetical protein DRQ36_01465 [bacterium]